MTNQVSLVGGSGIAYAYEPATIAGPWNNLAGNYAFASLSQAGRWHVFHVGETSGLRDGLADHPLWPRAAALGCTHVLVHVNDDGAQARQLERRDLIEGLRPPMDREHDPMAVTDA